MKELVVDENYQNSRLDRFLREKLKLSNGEICKHIRNNKIKLNKKSTKPNINIAITDIITYHPSIEIEVIETERDEIPLHFIEKVKKSIIFEDRNIIGINKPYGLSVQRSEISDIAIVDILSVIVGKKIYIVHRLDKETSGVMVLAKNKDYARKISTAFQDGLVKKEYIAVLDGVVKEKSGKITSYINKIPNYESIAEQNGNFGKFSETWYEVLKKDNESNTSLVKFYPKTGRIHQIRLHSLKISNGIIGDSKYNKASKGKLQLVAYSIEIPDIISLKVDNLPNHFSCNSYI